MSGPISGARFHVGITHDDAYLCLHVTRGTNPENRSITGN